MEGIHNERDEGIHREGELLFTDEKTPLLSAASPRAVAALLRPGRKLASRSLALLGLLGEG